MNFFVNRLNSISIAIVQVFFKEQKSVEIDFFIEIIISKLNNGRWIDIIYINLGMRIQIFQQRVVDYLTFDDVNTAYTDLF